jgi:hypothetical protein
MSLVLSLEFPSTMMISRSQCCSLKYSALIASMVFPMPRSSLIAGITMLTYIITHSQGEYKNKGVKRVLKKTLKKREKKGE